MLDFGGDDREDCTNWEDGGKGWSEEGQERIIGWHLIIIDYLFVNL